MIHDPHRRPLGRLAMAAAAMGLFLLAYYWGNQYKYRDSNPPVIEGVLIRPPIALPDFDLLDATGQPFTAKSFAEHWTLLSFGDPSHVTGHLAITRMIEAYNRLASDPDLQAMLQLTLASEREDPILARDFARLSPVLRILSGELGELQRLGASVGAPPPQGASAAPEDEEAPAMYLIGPSGRLVALFTGAQAPASIALDLSAIAKHFRSLFPVDD
jgi:hypothetical protein